MDATDQAKHSLWALITFIFVSGYFIWNTGVSATIAIEWTLLSQFMVFLRANHLVFLTKNLKNDELSGQYRKHNTITHLFNLVFGILFAAGFWLVLDSENHVVEGLILGCVLGVAGSTIYILGSSFRNYLWFLIPQFVVVYAHFISSDNPYLLEIFSLLTLGAILTITSAYRYHTNFIHNFAHICGLERAKAETIEILAKVGEFRDNDTNQHVERMSHSCYLMARELGMDEKEAMEVKRASALHDLGKIAISDDILKKPGLLTAEEITHLNSHVEIGYQILDMAKVNETLKLAKIIAVTHHEKWDGSGYPKGLKGEDIPIEGRIAAIADVYDSLTSRRPYKEPWTPEQAMNYLKEQSGSHFDPQLVELFAKVVDKVQHYSDSESHV